MSHWLIFTFMKRILFAMLVAFLFSCDSDEEEQTKIYSFSGTVRVSQLDGSDPVPLPDAKLKIHFYTGNTLLTVKLIESAEFAADASGNFTFQKKLPENTYTLYSLEVDSQYYRDCGGITSSHNTIGYQGFSPETSYSNDILVCHTGNVKIIARKTSTGSGSLTIDNRATAGSWTVTDLGELISADTEKTFYFFGSVNEVVFTFTRRTGSTVTSEEEVMVYPKAGTTVELTVDF
jgi:hypothetical protein